MHQGGSFNVSPCWRRLRCCHDAPAALRTMLRYENVYERSFPFLEREGLQLPDDTHDSRSVWAHTEQVVATAISSPSP